MSDLDSKTTGRFNELFVGWIAKRPILSVLAGLTLLAALCAGLPRVKADFTHRGFFAADDPKLLAFEAFERRFGNDEVVSVAVHSPSGIFDPDSAAVLRELTERMWGLPEVLRVDSISNFNWVHADGDDIRVEALLGPAVTDAELPERQRIALSHETLPDYLISRDAKTAVLYAHVKPSFEGASNAALITRATRDLVQELRRGDHELHVTGGPPVTFAFEEASRADMHLLPVALLIAAVFLIALLRSAMGVGLALVTLLLSVVGTFGIAGQLGLVQTALTMTVPSILIAVGVADTVHLLVTFFAALRRGTPRREAARHAISSNLLPTFLTSLTTALGLFSLVTANLLPIATLGVMAGLGTLLTWVLSQLVLGGLLFVLPFAPTTSAAAGQAATREPRLARWTSALVDSIKGRRTKIIMTTIAASLLASYVALGVDVNTDPMEYFRKDAPVRVATDLIERQMRSARAFEVEVHAGSEDAVKDPKFLRSVDSFCEWLEQQAGITQAVSILDVIKGTHRALHGDAAEEYRLPDDREAIAQELLLYTLGLPRGMDLNDRVSARFESLRITVLNDIARSSDAVRFVRSMEDKARSLGLDAHATGKNLLYQDTQDYVVRAFLGSLGGANLLIGLVMVLFLRSFKLGLIAMIPNIVPLVAAGALLRLIGQPLDMGTALVASVTLGISIDDTSHLLVNFAAARRRGAAPVAAMKAAMRQSSAALLATNAILITAFASFATASFMPNVFFGLLTAFTLAVALLADAVLLPALLMLGAREPGVEVAPLPAAAE